MEGRQVKIRVKFKLGKQSDGKRDRRRQSINRCAERRAKTAVK
jgi:hypothetical protein